MAQAERGSLKKSLGTLDVLALAFGTMIGWGWIMLAGKWVELAGVSGAVAAFLIGMVLCIFVGITYAELTPALPLTGGALVFSYRAMGYNASWFTGWMLCFAYVGVAAWEGPAMVTAIDYLIPLPRWGFLWNVAGFDVYASWAGLGAIGGFALIWLNYIGTKESAIFQTCATIAMAIGGVCFLVGGAVNGDLANMVPTFTGTSGVVAVILMVPAMFVGFDVIPQTAEEMNIPLNKVATVLILSICMAAAWYIVMIISIALSAPPEVRAAGAIPVADSFAYCMGSPIFGKLMIITALCGILTSWNGFIIGATRVLFGMGRCKMLPDTFAHMHPKYGTPSAALILVGIITCASPLLGKSALVWFVNASSFGTVIAYFMVALSFLVLRKTEPNLHRPYKVKNGTLFGILAVGVSIFFLVLYLPIGPGALAREEWLMVFGWTALGVVLYIMTQIKYGSSVSLAEREYMLFGKEYARPKFLNAK